MARSRSAHEKTRDTALFDAVKNGNLELVKALQPGLNDLQKKQTVAGNEQSLFSLAAFYSQSETLDYLLEILQQYDKSQIDSEESQLSDTLLQILYIKIQMKKEIKHFDQQVKILLNYGASPTLSFSNTGDNALHVVVKSHSTDYQSTLHLLLLHCPISALDKKNENNHTPLELALAHKNLMYIQMLQKKHQGDPAYEYMAISILMFLISVASKRQSEACLFKKLPPEILLKIFKDYIDSSDLSQLFSEDKLKQIFKFSREGDREIFRQNVTHLKKAELALIDYEKNLSIPIFAPAGVSVDNPLIPEFFRTKHSKLFFQSVKTTLSLPSATHELGKDESRKINKIKPEIETLLKSKNKKTKAIEILENHGLISKNAQVPSQDGTSSVQSQTTDSSLFGQYKINM